MQKIELNISLHDKQKEIHRTHSLFKVVKAGKRFGKTHWALYELLKAAETKGVYWYVSPTYRQSKNIAWRLMLDILPEFLIKRKQEQELTLELVNGSVIKLVGADDEDSLRGIHIDGLVIDEAAYVSEYCWKVILRGQLLGVKGKKSGFAYFIGSPNKKGRNWFSEFFEEAKARQNNGDKDWSAFYFTIYDNPLLDSEYVNKLKDGMPDDVWNLEYLAKESALSGVKFSEFDFNVHCKELKIEKDWRLVRGLDWGQDHPTTCLWIYINDKERFVYVDDEFKRSDLLIHESCEAIKQKTGDRQVEWSIIDPSTNKRNSQTPRSDKDEFARYGIACMDGDNRARGYDITKMFFKKKSIFINPRCKNLIYELRNLQYGDKEGDDCADSLRYALVHIHDLIFRELTFEGKESLEPKLKPLEFSVFDKRLFPQPLFTRNEDLNFDFLSQEVA